MAHDGMTAGGCSENGERNRINKRPKEIAARKIGQKLCFISPRSRRRGGEGKLAMSCANIIETRRVVHSNSEARGERRRGIASGFVGMRMGPAKANIGNVCK